MQFAQYSRYSSLRIVSQVRWYPSINQNMQPMSNEQIIEIGTKVKSFQNEDSLLKLLMEPDAGE